MCGLLHVYGGLIHTVYPQSTPKSGITPSAGPKLVDGTSCVGPGPTLIFVSARRGHGNRLDGPGACSQTDETRHRGSGSPGTRSQARREARPPAASSSLHGSFGSFHARNPRAAFGLAPAPGALMSPFGRPGSASGP